MRRLLRWCLSVCWSWLDWTTDCTFMFLSSADRERERGVCYTDTQQHKLSGTPLISVSLLIYSKWRDGIYHVRSLRNIWDVFLLFTFYLYSFISAVHKVQTLCLVHMKHYLHWYSVMDETLSQCDVFSLSHHTLAVSVCFVMFNTQSVLQCVAPQTGQDQILISPWFNI